MGQHHRDSAAAALLVGKQGIVYLFGTIRGSNVKSILSQQCRKFIGNIAQPAERRNARSNNHTLCHSLAMGNAKIAQFLNGMAKSVSKIEQAPYAVIKFILLHNVALYFNTSRHNRLAVKRQGMKFFV